jgi:hypothetical protein
MSEPIQFPHKPDPAPEFDLGEDASEVTPAGPPPTAFRRRDTQRLPADAMPPVSLTDVLLAPFTALPPETRAHLRTAGREATLTLSSLAGTLLKGAAIALNVAAESLKDYSARNSAPVSPEAAARRRVEIEVE